MPNDGHIIVEMPAQSDENHNSAVAEEDGDPFADIENGSVIRRDSARSNSTKMCMVMLALGSLSLVIIPGLVLGIVTSEMPVGIELCGAIATVASLFSGLYYYHNTRA